LEERPMARRRRYRRQDPFDLVGPVFALIIAISLLLAFFAPVLLRAVVSLIQLGFTVLVCGGGAVVLFFAIRAFIRRRHRQAELASHGTKGGVEPIRSFVYPDPLESVLRKEWRLDKTGPPQSQFAPQRSLQERLRAIDWFQFEKVVSAIYEVRGCTVRRLGGAKPDGGIDLIVEKDGERLVVQCKHWRKWSVGVRHVRELLGTLKDANIEKGVLVTLRGCTSEAKELADKHGIRVVEEMELVELMRNVDGSTNRRIGEILNDDRKLCPRCEHPLVIRTATKGMNQGEQFWGCSNYPRCRYILRDR